MANTNFFAELLARLFSAKPQFFKYIQTAALILGGISAFVLILSSNGVAIPSWLEWLNSKATIISTIIAAVIAQLPKKDVNP